MRHLEAPSSVERRLVAGFRGQAEFQRRPQPLGMWWRVAAWAAGLIVTAGIALFLAGGHQPERTERLRRHPTQLATVESAVETDVVEESGFIPLPNAETIAPNEEVNLKSLPMQTERAAVLIYRLTKGK